jgi:hypothetical protein
LILIEKGQKTEKAVEEASWEYKHYINITQNVSG